MEKLEKQIVGFFAFWAVAAGAIVLARIAFIICELIALNLKS